MQKSNNVHKTIILYLFPILALVLCLFSKETSLAARKALYLCLDVVIPSLFPFFVLSKILIPFISGFSIPEFMKKLIERFFNLPYYTIIVILLGFISGYPNGAKMSRDMFDQGLLDSRQASKIISVANNCSPLFIVGTIGAGLFKSVKLGVFLLLLHWASGLIAAFILGRLTNSLTSEREIIKQQVLPKPSESFSVLFPLSIEESAILCIKVTGYVVFFAVISELLFKLGIFYLVGSLFAFLIPSGNPNSNLQDFISAISRGVMEITSGSQAIYQLKGTALNIQLAVISLMFGFAGFSVHTQIMGIMKGTGCKYRILFIGKLLHGIIGGLLTLVTIYFIPLSIQTSGLVAMPTLNLSWTRPLIIGVLIISLLVSPYKGIRAQGHKSTRA